MNLREMHSWFDILQMEGHSMSFTSREKDHIINRAQVKYVNEVLHKFYYPSVQADEKPQMVYSPTESIISGHDVLRPLLMLVNLQANQYGVITFGDIASKVDTWLGASATGAIGGKYPWNYTGSKIMTILSLTMTNKSTTNSPQAGGLQTSGHISLFDNKQVPVRYVNAHERYKEVLNVFRRPKDYQPLYYLEKTRIRVLPVDVGSSFFTVACVKEPRPVHLDPSNQRTSKKDMNCELPDSTHDEIMSIALDDAGLATRDAALVQLNQSNKQNLVEQK